jgi:hypothetical protein
MFQLRTKEEFMKIAFIAVVALSLALSIAVPVFAADGGQPPMGQSQSFEQRQAEILKFIDARAAGIQEERSCVQAAKNFDDLKACRDKAIAEMEKRRSNMMGHGPGGGQTPSPVQ